MSAIRRSTRYWKATERSESAGATTVLSVTGDVEVGRSAEIPHLRPALPRDVSPNVLHLELVILSAGQGEPSKIFRPVRFERKVASGQYSEVEISFEGKRIGRCSVQVMA